ncbi:hypothetical protein K439DRAFT_701886 [Ramaria rubella]|nr:hypothetical protein K439DRAFT_701886 [Ramaria rubella]
MSSRGFKISKHSNSSQIRKLSCAIYRNRRSPLLIFATLAPSGQVRSIISIFAGRGILEELEDSELGGIYCKHKLNPLYAQATYQDFYFGILIFIVCLSFQRPRR